MTLARVITERNSKGQVLKYKILFNGEPVPDTHKYCPACNTVKEKTEFTTKGNACKICANARARQHRINRRKDPSYVKQFNYNKKSILKANKRQAVEYKGNVCYDCKLSFPDCVYDFHHLDSSQKDMNPSALIRLGFEKAKQELDKCVMLCSNCHRIRHFGYK